MIGIFANDHDRIEYNNNLRAAQKKALALPFEEIVDFKLLSKNVPFELEEDQIFYVEKHFNLKNDRIIRENIDFINLSFRKRCISDFIYLPLYIEHLINYNAPNLPEKEIKRMSKEALSLYDYMLDDVDYESFLICTCLTHDTRNAEGNIRVKVVPFNISELFSKRDISRAAFTMHVYQMALGNVCYTPRFAPFRDNYMPCEHIEPIINDEPCFSYHRPLNIEDENDFDPETRGIIGELRERIRLLHDKGISTYYLHKLIDESVPVPLSRLRITKDFRLFLPEYNNREIVMDPLPKAVFILFLRHKDGIRFKEMCDYRDELMQIYLNLKPKISKDKREQSIASLTDSLSNSLNEKCARVREAFIGEIADEIARNYYITGRRGEPKRIILDESLIEWE